MKKPTESQFQVPLLLAFREAAAKGDARLAIDERIEGERVVSRRGSLRRRGTEEATLRESLGVDLVSLTNTIDLGSVADLSGLEAVKASIVNFGLADIGHLVVEDAGIEAVGPSLKTSLLRHEPRLRPASITVERAGDIGEDAQKLRYAVRAEMICRPLDVPLEFVAELDIGAGKLTLPSLARPS